MPAHWLNQDGDELHRGVPRVSGYVRWLPLGPQCSRARHRTRTSRTGNWPVACVWPCAYLAVRTSSVCRSNQRARWESRGLLVNPPTDLYGGGFLRGPSCQLDGRRGRAGPPPHARAFDRWTGRPLPEIRGLRVTGHDGSQVGDEFSGGLVVPNRFDVGTTRVEESMIC